jgi:predicted secreted protein
MIRPTFRFAIRLLVALALPLPSVAAPPAEATQTERGLPTVDLSADASRRAPNDMAIATVYFEASDPNPASLSKQVNAAITSALEQIRQVPAVSAKSSGTATYPIYGKDGRRIEGWRMRSDLQLESRDIGALSDLLGRLQTKLALAGLVMQPAPETRRSTADLAARDAIHAFQARAEAIAATLGKPYRIRHLSIGYGGMPRPIHPTMKTAAFAAEAASLAVEAGESEIAVTVSGTIELTE